MKIGDKYLIESDGTNVTLYEVIEIKSGKNQGKTRLDPLGYFKNLEGCLKECVRREINATYLQDLSEVVDKIKELEDTLICRGRLEVKNSECDGLV